LISSLFHRFARNETSGIIVSFQFVCDRLRLFDGSSRQEAEADGGTGEASGGVEPRDE
jgi:hypothetical protein